MLKDYENRFSYLIEPARALTVSYENAARYFDELKETILIGHGLVHTAEMFHKTAHWFPGQFDTVGDILHQRHVIQRYGATPEMPVRSDDMEDVFSTAVAALDAIEAELRNVITVCENGGDPALARQFENLQIALSREHEKYLTAWKMLEESDSASSFDNWIAHMEEGAD